MNPNSISPGSLSITWARRFVGRRFASWLLAIAVAGTLPAAVLADRQDARAIGQALIDRHQHEAHAGEQQGRRHRAQGFRAHDLECEARVTALFPADPLAQ